MSQDEDTRQVLNTMANPGQIGSLKFYLLPCTWMEACLPFLLGQTDQRPTLKIDNASTLLLNTGGAVSDEEAEESKFYEQRGKTVGVSPTLRRDIVHEIDFYCVGAHVWNLISEKFGFDVELSYKVLSQPHGGLVVNLETQKVDVPASGRFDYQPVAKKPTDVVSDEDDDLVRYHFSLAKFIYFSNFVTHLVATFSFLALPESRHHIQHRSHRMIH
jgi:hypothetical protein